MYFGWQSAALKPPLSDWWTFIFSHFCFPQKSAAGVTFMEQTDRNWIPPLYKVVIEYHIYYFPIHKVVSAVSISCALSDFISSTLDDLYSFALLLSAKSAFVSLGTLRTFELITVSTFGCRCAPPSLQWIMIFLHWDKGLLLLKVENEAWFSVGQTFSFLLC